jgi:putative membrane protein
MIVFRLASNELGRFTTRTLTRLALFAMLIVPLLYSSLYLYSNAYPYVNLKNVPVAIVNNDKGHVQTESGETAVAGLTASMPQNMGDELTKKLIESKSFDWRKASADDIEKKVIDGEYAFALIIGEDFTENIDKLSSFEAVKTDMQLLLNDANSYVLHEIAEQMEYRVEAEVAEEISKQALILQLEGIAEIRSELTKAVDGAKELAAGAKEAEEGAKSLKEGVSEFADALLQLKNGMDELNKSVAALPSAISQLKDGSAALSSGASELQSGLDQIDEITSTIAYYENEANIIWRDIVFDLREVIIHSTLPLHIKEDLLRIIDDIDGAIENLHTDVSEYAEAIDQLDAGAGQLADGAAQLDAGIGQLEAASSQLVGAINELDEGVRTMHSRFGEIVTGVIELSDGLKQLASGARELETGLRDGVKAIPELTAKEREDFADVVTNPVTFKTKTIAPANTYAVGLAPFFMALAGWIGVYILFILMKPISTRALISNVAPWKVALGGWLPPAVIGVLQMSIMYVALHFIIKMNPVYAIYTLLFLFLMVLTYLTIVHFLITAWGKVGLFTGLVLMIVQLTTAGGTFPWQTMPTVDQALHQALPMAHAVDALRNLIYGGSLDIALQKSLFFLAYFVVFAILDIITVRIRRRWTMKTLFPAI